MTKPGARASRKNAKIRLPKSTGSEIIAALKITPAELRRAEALVDRAERSLRRPSGSTKRAMSSRSATK